MQPTSRNCPLILVMAADPAQATDLVRFWRDRGAVVLYARDDAGCLRVATCAGPDVIVLDRSVSPRLLRLIGAHPVSARAQIEWISDHASPRGALAA